MKRITAFILFCAILTGCAARADESAPAGLSESTAAYTTKQTSENTAAAADTKNKTTTYSAEKTAASETTTQTAAETTTQTTAETTTQTTAETTTQTTAETTTQTTAETTTQTAAQTTTQATAETTTQTAAETTAQTAAEAPPVLYSEPIENQADGSLLIFGERYVQAFGDEFNGNRLDALKWSRCPEQRRQDLNCYWSDDCSYLNGEGQLVLEALYDGDFLMGGIRSKGKFEQAYGYFEVKCTLNTTPGWWTAFWLMGDTVINEDNGGTDGTEIDIYESAYFGESAVQHTLNWDGYGAAHKSLGSITAKEGLYDGGYHTFSLLWTDSEYVYFIDGEETWRTDAKEAQGVCTVPLYLKMTAETGSWTFSDMDEALLPDKILVDYIRVYEKAQ